MKPAFLILLNILLTLPSLGQDYEIHLNKPGRVGQKERLFNTGTRSEDLAVFMDGKEVRRDKKEVLINFAGTSTALAVTTNGIVNRASIQIEKLTRMEDGVSKEVLPPGTVVEASPVKGKVTFQMEGKAVNRDVAEALELVITMDDGDLTNDEIFGTRKRVRVGDSWTANPEAVAKMMNQDPNMIVKDATSKVTLKAVLRGLASDRLLISMDISGTMVPINQKPGQKLMDGGMKAKMTVTTEIPTTQNPALIATTMSTTVTGRILAGPNLEAGAQINMARTFRGSSMVIQ